MINAQLDLIQELQTDEYWQHITAPMLETVRKRLRDLVKLIEKAKRKIVYTDFVDEIGAPTGIELPGISVGMDFERFKAKARRFRYARRSDSENPGPEAPRHPDRRACLRASVRGC